MIWRLFSILTLVLSAQLSTAQDLELRGGGKLSGIYLADDSLPFWMIANQDAQFGPETTFSVLGEFHGRYRFSDQAQLSAGFAGFYRNETDNDFRRRDLYLEFRTAWIRARAGSRKDSVRAQGLSATNKDFLFSGNTRPLSGLKIEAFEPLRISNTFSVDWGIAHYSLNDDRFVEKVWVHYKRLGLNVRFDSRSKLTARLTHYAQWAGNSPVFGDLPDDFSAFIDVFFASKPSENVGIDQENGNAVGNHLGSYYLDYYLDMGRGVLNLYHEHPFEDGSGTRLANFPDGVWGIHYRQKEHNWFDGILYELITTKDQSGGPGGSGADSYFSNTVYRSGWSYESRVIGMPFILFDPNEEVTEESFPIFSDRSLAHHFGFAGHFRQLSWRIKSTIVTFYGRYNEPIDPARTVWSNLIETTYNMGPFGRLYGTLGWDTGDAPGRFAALIGYSYTF